MEAPRSKRVPSVAATAFVAPNATVIGDVTLKSEASIWYGAVVRGDTDAIHIGQQTNVQDLCVLHADEGFPCRIGQRVTIGHAAIIHGACVEDEVLIGMRSVIMNGARIGTGSIVAVGAIVTEGTEIPPGSVALGAPARVVRTVEPRDRERIARGAEHYVQAARQMAR